MAGALDLTGLPFIDGHIHPPYREHPADLAAYRWPWYEGDRGDTALAAETAAYRWGIRQLAGDLGCEPQEQAVFDAVRSRSPAAWLAELVTREGVGAGHGIDVDLGQAHESAIKEAETDAMKRALMTFGNQFGLALYDKTQANVADEPDSYALYIEECKRHIAAETDPEVLLTWWNSDAQKKMRRDFQMDASDVNALKEFVIKRREALAKVVA